MKTGIIGLPQVGKTSLFRILTKAHLLEHAYANPREAHVGVAKVPDDRLDRLAALYPAGGEVNPENLAAKGGVRAGELVKVLGQGEVTTALQVSAHGFSASARAKITAAGGTVTEL